MKFSKFILPILGLCTLSSCGSSVSKELFSKHVADIEEHQYKKVTVEETGETNNTTEKIIFKYTLQDGKYVADSDNSLSTTFVDFFERPYVKVYSILDDIFDSYEGSDKAIDEYATITKEIKYYIKPFKIVGNYNATYKSDEVSGKREISYTYKFDKYGYLTYLEYDSTYNCTKKLEDYKKVESKKSHTKLSISYKD